MKYKTRTITEYAVECNRCGGHGPWGLSPEEARELAAEEGWELWQEQAVCYFCKWEDHPDQK
ncbi:MAG: hypothetical protein NZ769_08260 [Anaerolineae bacterium]|nr:hypothetical protein [Anaerolineae bacterium]